MSSSSYRFKHTWTGNSLYMNISPFLPLNQLRNFINSNVNSLLTLDNYDIVVTGLPMSEFHIRLNESTNICLKNLNTKAFYIRPINEPIPEIFVRYQRELEQRLLDHELRNNNHELRNNNQIENIAECSICYENFDPGSYTNNSNSNSNTNNNSNLNSNPLAWTCQHYLSCCAECINSWRHSCIIQNISITCPLCRENI